MDTVKLLIDKGADINSQGDKIKCNTPLMDAAESGHLNMVKFLISIGADLNLKDCHNDTALTIAAKKGHTDIVKYLTEQGTIKDEWTSLLCAIVLNDIKSLETLLKNKALVTQKDHYGTTPLMIAAKTKFPGTVDLLIRKGSEINATNCYDGHSALTIAVKNGRKENVSCLLSHGAELSSHRGSTTALMHAAEYGQIEIAQMLIDAGADVNQFDGNHEENFNAITYAVYNGHTEMVRMLLNNGASPSSFSFITGFIIDLAKKLGFTDIVELLNYHSTSLKKYNSAKELETYLQSGMDVNETDIEGNSPLIWAARYNKSDCIPLLLNYGADVNFQNKKGQTALICLCDRQPQEDEVRLLISKGADVNHKDEFGQTPFYKAVHKFTMIGGAIRNFDKLNSLVSILKILLENEADINIQTKSGETPLMEAVRWYAPLALLKFLIENGADIHAIDNQGHNALWLADHVNNQEGLKFLKETGQ